MAGEASPSQESGFVQRCLMALAHFSLAMGTCHNPDHSDIGGSQLGKGWLMGKKNLLALKKTHKEGILHFFL